LKQLNSGYFETVFEEKNLTASAIIEVKTRNLESTYSYIMSVEKSFLENVLIKMELFWKQ